MAAKKKKTLKRKAKKATAKRRVSLGTKKKKTSKKKTTRGAKKTPIKRKAAKKTVTKRKSGKKAIRKPAKRLATKKTAAARSVSRTVGSSSILPNMGRISEYRVVTMNQVRDLEDEVNYLISKGWEPLGGLMEEDDNFFQAMVIKAST